MAKTYQRDKISGFEFTVFGYTVEVVTLGDYPCVLAIWHNTRFVWRIGKVTDISNAA